MGAVHDAIILQEVSLVTLINQEISMRILKDVHIIIIYLLYWIVVVSSDTCIR